MATLRTFLRKVELATENATKNASLAKQSRAKRLEIEQNAKELTLGDIVSTIADHNHIESPLVSIKERPLMVFGTSKIKGGGVTRYQLTYEDSTQVEVALRISPKNRAVVGGRVDGLLHGANDIIDEVEAGARPEILSVLREDQIPSYVPDPQDSKQIDIDPELEARDIFLRMCRSNKKVYELPKPVQHHLRQSGLQGHLTQYVVGTNLQEIITGEKPRLEQYDALFENIPVDKLIHKMHTKFWFPSWSSTVIAHALHRTATKNGSTPVLFKSYKSMLEMEDEFGTFAEFKEKYHAERNRVFAGSPLMLVHGDPNQGNFLLSKRNATINGYEFESDDVEFVDSDETHLNIPYHDFMVFSVLSDFEKTSDFERHKAEMKELQTRTLETMGNDAAGNHHTRKVYREVENSLYVPLALLKIRKAAPDSKALQDLIDLYENGKHPIKIEMGHDGVYTSDRLTLTEFETYFGWALKFGLALKKNEVPEEDVENYRRSCNYLLHKARCSLDEYTFHNGDVSMYDAFNRALQTDETLQWIDEVEFDPKASVAYLVNIYQRRNVGGRVGAKREPMRIAA